MTHMAQSKYTSSRTWTLIEFFLTEGMRVIHSSHVIYYRHVKDINFFVKRIRDEAATKVHIIIFDRNNRCGRLKRNTRFNGCISHRTFRMPRCTFLLRFFFNSLDEKRCVKEYSKHMRDPYHYNCQQMWKILERVHSMYILASLPVEMRNYSRTVVNACSPLCFSYFIGSKKCSHSGKSLSAIRLIELIPLQNRKLIKFIYYVSKNFLRIFLYLFSLYIWMYEKLYIIVYCYVLIVRATFALFSKIIILLYDSGYI